MPEKNQYQGISIDRSRPNTPWRCRIRIGNKQHYVGRFKTEDEALEAKENYLNNYHRKKEEEHALYLKARCQNEYIKH